MPSSNPADPLDQDRQTSAASNISFTRMSANDSNHAESSSQAESRSSTGNRSSWLSNIRHEKPSTPDNSHGKNRRSLQSEPDSQPSRSSTGRRSRKSGGFLLGEMFSSHSSLEEKKKGDRHGKRKIHDDEGRGGDLSVVKRRHQGQVSTESGSLGASPLSREVPSSQHRNDGASHEDSASGNGQAQGLDPAQLVQMALNLSQSRRRHASNSLHLPLPAAGVNPARVRSSGTYGRDTVRRRSAAGRRVSQLVDETSNPPSGREGTPDQQNEERDSWPEEPVFMAQNYSPATLARVEKAQRYFELANEHRRLLEYLPPLKADSSAPGNYVVSSKNTPGTSFPAITRTFSYTNSKHELGRAYDPLQAIRNRRQRNRERRTMNCPTERWQDVGVVKGFVDQVENAAKGTGYRHAEDRVRLPVRTDDPSDEKEETDDRFKKRHRRSGTVGSFNGRPDNEWMIDPTELLADTYWVEQEDHKRIIENRRGMKIFPQRARQSAEQTRRSRDMPIEERPSMESRRSGQSERNHSVGSMSDREPEERSSRRRHLLPSVLKPGSKLKTSSRSRSVSTSRSSSSERRQRPKHFEHRVSEDYDNTWALDRHMRKMIAEEEQHNDDSTPDLTSPDHWNSKHTPFPNARAREDSQGTKRSSLAVPAPNGNPGGGAALGHGRSHSADGRAGRPSLSLTNSDHHRDSIEGYETTDPQSPVDQTNVPQIGMDLSPPQHKQTKSKMPKFGLFKGTHKAGEKPDVDRNNIDRTDFAAVDTEKPAPREASNGSTEPAGVRKSFDSFRPSLAGWRSKTEANPTLLRSDTASTMNTKEGSGVGRFFRGRKIGDLMRSDNSRMGSRDRRGDKDKSRNVSYETDPEDNRSVRSSFDRHHSNDELSPRSSTDHGKRRPGPGQYYTQNLPSFTSPRKQSETPSLSTTDPISRQQAAQRKLQKPSRFDKLPKISLPDADHEGHGGARSDTLVEDQRRKSYGFLSDVASAPRDSKTADPNDNDDDDSSSNVSPGAPLRSLKPGQGRKGRHWSISDNCKPPVASLQKTFHPSARDIDRIRALLLASGIKAYALQLQAQEPPLQPNPFLATALETSGEAAPSPLPARQNEHVEAAKLLSKTLSSRLEKFETTLETFQDDTLPALNQQQENLRGQVADSLTQRVHETSDTADATTLRLTTQQTLRVKQVDDAIDAMWRRRRRQWRGVKKVGFKLLEWVVLGAMWGIWGVVVMFNSVRGILGFFLAALRWLLIP